MCLLEHTAKVSHPYCFPLNLYRRLQGLPPHIVICVDTGLESLEVASSAFRAFSPSWEIFPAPGLCCLVWKSLFPTLVERGVVGRLHWMTVAICGGNKKISGVYWRPSLSQQEEGEKEKLKSLLSLGTVMGDLNAHHPSWDCNGSCDARGLYIRELADASHSSLMPLSPSVSFFSPTACSCVDLAIGTDVLCSAFLPKGESDHAPLVVSLSLMDGWIPPRSCSLPQTPPYYFSEKSVCEGLGRVCGESRIFACCIAPPTHRDGGTRFFW